MVWSGGTGPRTRLSARGTVVLVEWYCQDLRALHCSATLQRYTATIHCNATLQRGQQHGQQHGQQRAAAHIPKSVE